MTCISFGLSAQHQKKNFKELSAAERAEKMSNRMAEELKLSEEQRKQVSKLLLENATRQEELIQKRKAELKDQQEHRMEQEKKIAAILTEEQKVIWEQQRESRQHRQAHPNRGEYHERRGPKFRRGR